MFVIDVSCLIIQHIILVTRIINVHLKKSNIHLSYHASIMVNTAKLGY